MNKPNFVRIFKTAQTAMSKHSPEILTGIGIAGMITTTVLAVRATPKAVMLIEEKKKEEGMDELKPVETVKVAWKCYIPAAVLGATSVACLVGASRVSLRRNAALATAYKLSETALTEYREQVVEAIGEKKEQAVRDKVNQKQIEKVPVGKNEIYITGDGESLCLDPLSGRLFKSDIDRIRKAENEINRRMIHDICGSASLNEFYDEIGLEHTDLGDILGWNTEHLINLDITPGLTDNDKPCLVIGHYNAPKYEY
jgi:hypothetical protein